MSTLRLFGSLQAVSQATASRAGILMASALVALAYFAGAKLGLALTLPPHPLSVLWPPNAILMGALLLAPVRWWPALILAVLPAHLLAEMQEGIPSALVLGWFVSNVCEALIGAGLVRRVLDAPKFDSLNNVGIFILCAVLAAPFLSSFLDVAFVVAVGWSQDGYWQLWKTRLFSNALANLAIVPMIVTAYAVVTNPRQEVSRERIAEGLLLLFGLVTVNLLAFDSYVAYAVGSTALLYFPLPFLLWTALRFGPAGSSAAFVVVVVAVVWGAAHGRGPFATDEATNAALPVQLFLTLVGTTLLGLAGVLEERRSAERKLRSSEQRFAVAFRANPEAIAISRVKDGMLLDVNDRWLDMLGYMRSDVVGRTGAELGLYFNDAEQRRLADAVDERGIVREHELDLRTRWGSSLNAVVSTECVDLDGESSIITIIRDVTQYKSTLELLRSNVERTQLVLRATNDVIYDWDVDNDKLWWNDQGHTYFGIWSEDGACHLASWLQRVHPEDQERVGAAIAQFVDHGAAVSELEYRLRRADGSHSHIHGRGVAIRSDDGKARRVIGSMTDITDRKRAEDANLQLVHVSRLAVLGELTASIAHEINQPLGAILSNTDSADVLLNQEPVRVAELRQIISDIRNDDMRAGDVIRHIRDLLRKRELTMKPFDLNRAIGDVLSLVSADLGRHRVVVETELKPLPLVVGDQVHIQQVVLNLIFNAVDAMSQVSVSERRLWIATARSGAGGVEVSIADSGPGIAQCDFDRLFESFYTTKADGMGLGLSIARSIVEAHCGTIRAEARSERGAVFRFTVPKPTRKDNDGSVIIGDRRWGRMQSYTSSTTMNRCATP